MTYLVMEKDLKSFLDDTTLSKLPKYPREASTSAKDDNNTRKKPGGSSLHGSGARERSASLTELTVASSNEPARALKFETSLSGQSASSLGIIDVGNMSGLSSEFGPICPPIGSQNRQASDEKSLPAGEKSRLIHFYSKKKGKISSALSSEVQEPLDRSLLGSNFPKLPASGAGEKGLPGEFSSSDDILGSNLKKLFTETLGRSCDTSIADSNKKQQELLGKEAEKGHTVSSLAADNKNLSIESGIKGKELVPSKPSAVETASSASQSILEASKAPAGHLDPAVTEMIGTFDKFFKGIGKSVSEKLGTPSFFDDPFPTTSSFHLGDVSEDDNQERSIETEYPAGLESSKLFQCYNRDQLQQTQPKSKEAEENEKARLPSSVNKSGEIACLHGSGATSPDKKKTSLKSCAGSADFTENSGLDKSFGISDNSFLSREQGIALLSEDERMFDLQTSEVSKDFSMWSGMSTCPSSKHPDATSGSSPKPSNHSDSVSSGKLSIGHIFAAKTENLGTLSGDESRPRPSFGTNVFTPLRLACEGEPSTAVVTLSQSDNSSLSISAADCDVSRNSDHGTSLSYSTISKLVSDISLGEDFSKIAAKFYSKSTDQLSERDLGNNEGSGSTGFDVSMLDMDTLQSDKQDQLKPIYNVQTGSATMSSSVSTSVKFAHATKGVFGTVRSDFVNPELKHGPQMAEIFYPTHGLSSPSGIYPLGSAADTFGRMQAHTYQGSQHTLLDCGVHVPVVPLTLTYPFNYCGASPNFPMAGTASHSISPFTICVTGPGEVICPLTCVGNFSKTHITLQNPTNKLLYYRFLIFSVLVNGQSLPISSAGLSFPEYVRCPGSKAVKVQLVFAPERGASSMSADVQVLSYLSLDEDSATPIGMAHVMKVMLSAESPNIQLVHRDGYKMNFSNIPENSIVADYLTVSNFGKASVCLRLQIFEVKNEIHQFSFDFESERVRDFASRNGFKWLRIVNSRCIFCCLPGCENVKKEVKGNLPISLQTGSLNKSTRRGLVVETFEGTVAAFLENPAMYDPIGVVFLSSKIGIVNFSIDPPLLSKEPMVLKTEGEASVEEKCAVVNTGSIPVNMKMKMQSKNSCFTVSPTTAEFLPETSVEIVVCFNPKMMGPDEKNVSSVLQGATYPYGRVFDLIEVKGTVLDSEKAPRSVLSESTVTTVVDPASVLKVESNKKYILFAAVNTFWTVIQSFVLRNPSGNGPVKIKLTVQQDDYTFQLSADDHEENTNTTLGLSLLLQPKSCRKINIAFTPVEVSPYETEVIIQPDVSSDMDQGYSFAVPLVGYGGCSEIIIENETIKDNVHVLYLENHGGGDISSTVHLFNTGQRSAFVKAVVLQSKTYTEHPGIYVQPSSFILHEKHKQHLTVKLNIAGQGLLDIDGYFILLIYWGDEVLRQKMRTQCFKETSKYLRTMDICLKRVNFDTHFQGEDAVGEREVFGNYFLDHPTFFKCLHKITMKGFLPQKYCVDSITSVSSPSAAISTLTSVDRDERKRKSVLPSLVQTASSTENSQDLADNSLASWLATARHALETKSLDTKDSSGCSGSESNAPISSRFKVVAKDGSICVKKKDDDNLLFAAEPSGLCFYTNVREGCLHLINHSCGNVSFKVESDSNVVRVLTVEGVVPARGKFDLRVQPVSFETAESVIKVIAYGKELLIKVKIFDKSKESGSAPNQGAREKIKIHEDFKVLRKKIREHEQRMAKEILDFPRVVTAVETFVGGSSETKFRIKNNTSGVLKWKIIRMLKNELQKSNVKLKPSFGCIAGWDAVVVAVYFCPLISESFEEIWALKVWDKEHVLYDYEMKFIGNCKPIEMYKMPRVKITPKSSSPTSLIKYSPKHGHKGEKAEGIERFYKKYFDITTIVDYPKLIVFKDTIVGECSETSFSLLNKTENKFEWIIYRVSMDESELTEAEESFTYDIKIIPSCGELRPSESIDVCVKFLPASRDEVEETWQLRVKDASFFDHSCKIEFFGNNCGTDSTESFIPHFPLEEKSLLSGVDWVRIVLNCPLVFKPKSLTFTKTHRMPKSCRSIFIGNSSLDELEVYVSDPGRPFKVKGKRYANIRAKSFVEMEIIFDPKKAGEYKCHICIMCKDGHNMNIALKGQYV